MRRLYFFYAPLFLFSVSLFAQKITISGNVLDEIGETLIGVNIINLNTKEGTISDVEGRFSITAEAENELLFSYVGFDDFVYIVRETTAQKSLKIELKTAQNVLNGVTVSASRRKERILDAPASVSIITSQQINQQTPLAPQDILKRTMGVDVMETGLQSANVVVRGFNNPFSTDLLTMSDNRLTRVPSLRINAFQMIPLTTDDIERVEVLRGAASALYGPNSSNGVVHFITKSPIDFQQVKLSTAIGVRAEVEGEILDSDNALSPLFDEPKISDRMLYQASAYVAKKLKTKSDKLQMGLKISANYFTATDWKYNDPFETDSIIKGYQTYLGRVDFDANENEVADSLSGDFVNNQRDFGIERSSFDGRYDFRWKNEIELIFSGGISQVSNVELSPLGSIQAIDWRNWYAQTRFIHKNLFAQFYVNGNNAGDSYFLRTGDVNRDRSKLYAAQVQHSWQSLKKLKFVYGTDVFFTRPDTRYTINGRFEDNDNINEYGAYLHGDYKISNQFDFVGALRLDHHSRVGGLFFSPRLALLYKPSPKNTFRATFNRSFKTPGSGGFFADALSATLPTDIDIRVMGNVDGFDFNYAQNPYFDGELLPQFQTPFGGENELYDVGNQLINNEAWQSVLATTVDEFAALFEGNDAGINVDLIANLVTSMLPDTLINVGHEVKTLDLSSRRFVDAENWKNLQNVQPLSNAITNTYELGYKGILAEMIFVQADAYYSQIENFLAPTTLLTPNVVLNTDDLLNELTPTLNELIPLLDGFSNLVNRLDGLEGYGVENGTVQDEIENALIAAAGNLPIGTISPEGVEGDGTMVLATRNIGDLSIWGFDIDVATYLSENIKIGTSYSFVNKDSIAVDNAQFGFVALNSPRHRFRMNGNYDIKKIGLNVGLGWRWQAGFPVNAGVFVGRIPAIHNMSFNLAWQPIFYPKLQLNLSVQNLYNNTQQFFVGAPQIGRTSILKIAYVF